MEFNNVVEGKAKTAGRGDETLDVCRNRIEEGVSDVKHVSW